MRPRARYISAPARTLHSSIIRHALHHVRLRPAHRLNRGLHRKNRVAGQRRGSGERAIRQRALGGDDSSEHRDERDDGNGHARERTDNEHDASGERGRAEHDG